MGKHFVMKMSVGPGTAGTVSDLLAARTGLSKSRIKDAMNKGAVWIRKRRGGLRRLRRATTAVNAGDSVEIYYDESLLSLEPPRAVCLSDRGEYSVWYKPAGLMSQGTMYGDHCSLLRQAEISSTRPKKVFLVHRLDREASGIMLVAHGREAAARLSELFRRGLITKEYRIEVRGNLLEKGKSGTMDIPLDGRHAVTEYEAESYDPERNTSTARVIIRTGRLHQIRRHFAHIGFPVMGDPKYGTGNKNTEGMKLAAVSLRFVCPFRNKEAEFSSPELNERGMV